MKHPKDISSPTPENKNFGDLLKTKLPLYYIIFIVILSVAFGYEWEKIALERKETKSGTQGVNKNVQANVTGQTTDAFASMKILRLKHYTLTHPVVLDDIGKEYSELQGLKQDLNSVIKNYEADNKVNSASVYLVDFNNNGWIDINEDEQFHPASLLKLTVLISYLKRSETHPEILDKTMTLTVHDYAPGQTFEEDNIKVGVPYKVSDLLERMIVHSDNYATTLLDQQLDSNSLNELFLTLNIQRKPFLDPDFSISSRDYSKMMRVLYNASYLNERNSQRALAILTRTNFNKGLLKPLPKDIVVAHKFGENSLRPLKELHESGIVYAGKKTYLITVMTKGKSLDDLPPLISDISLKVYNYFSR